MFQFVKQTPEFICMNGFVSLETKIKTNLYDVTISIIIKENQS